VATLVPPRDVHNHGHVPGTGPSPYSLILLGDDMLLFGREEYDPGRGTWRALPPSDPGRSNRWPSVAGNTFIRAMPRWLRRDHHDMKARRPCEAARGRDGPWKHPAHAG